MHPRDPHVLSFELSPGTAPFFLRNHDGIGAGAPPFPSTPPLPASIHCLHGHHALCVQSAVVNVMANKQQYRALVVLNSVYTILFDVLFFWQRRLISWWFRKSPRDVLLETLAEARVYEEWEAAAFQIDEVLGYDLWRQNPTSKYYDYRLIYERLQAILDAREDDDILSLVNLLRSGLVRNLGNITAPRLYNRAYAGTKLLIEDYVTQVALAVESVTNYPTSPTFGNSSNSLNYYDHGSGGASVLTNQAKLDVLHDTRQAFGRSALVLQGGAMFGLCHLGVVKALHLRGLLPRIIVGTATGALIAALVGVHTEDELLDFLTGEGIDLSAFWKPRGTAAGEKKGTTVLVYSGREGGKLATLVRRVKRYLKTGYFLDVGVLEECVRANVGDLTFEEAYARTKRVLNITISSTGGGVPSLLNYLTAPNVLIWSAALASNATNHTLYAPITLQCKTTSGKIEPWHVATPSSPSHINDSTKSPPPPPPPPRTVADEKDSPLARIAELFNVNHFIVSQARPYLAPFLRSDLGHTSGSPAAAHVGGHSGGMANPGSWFGRLSLNRGTGYFTTPLLRLMLLELQHRLSQLDTLGLLPPGIRRFLLDEHVPGASLTLVPDIALGDLARLLENPTAEAVEGWILRGERSVWPAVGALKVRCAIEVELDRGYQVVRRRGPMDGPVGPGGGWGGVVGGGGLGGKGKKKRRASSFGSGMVLGGTAGGD
ncbi:hypothetical protein BDY21DRAFT_413084, partial [Lineolata rhizophorae]